MRKEYFYILIILISKICRPYFKKQLNDKIDDNFFIFYNTITILVLFLLYNFTLNFLNIKKFDIMRLINNYTELDIKFKSILLILGILTLINTMSFFELDNSKDQSKMPIIIKSLSTIATILISCYINGENITKKQIIGIILLLSGLYALTSNEKK
jgi:drug/metabolite transporter (DMT)-like permease